MVGSDYQAVIPDGLRQYGDAMPYENEDKLLWDPSGISEANLTKYLTAIHEIQSSSVTEGIGAIPVGPHVRDDEQVRIGGDFGLSRRMILESNPTKYFNFFRRCMLFSSVDITLRKQLDANELMPPHL